MSATIQGSDDTEALPGMPMRVVLASLSLAAGIIHLVMVPAHAQESMIDGVGFAVVGWLQVALAFAVVLRPSRFVLQATAALNAIAIGLWVWSRTAGLPFGANSGVAQDSALIDQLATVLEGGLVIGAVALLIRPTLGSGLRTDALVVASVIPILILVATSLALTDPKTADHHAGSATADPAAELVSQRCDLGMNPTSYWSELTTAGLDTSALAAPSTAAPSTAASSTAAPAAANHHGGAAAPTTGAPAVTTPPPFGGRGSAELDELIALSTKTGEGDSARAVVALSEVSDDVYQAWLSQIPAFTAAAAAAAPATGGHGGGLGPQAWTAMTSQPECDRLSEELALARETAMKYPTAADAEADGYTQVTTYVPGIAAHWMKFPYVDGKFSITEPEMILYDGNGADARVVGLSYYIMQDSPMMPTQGFTGDNDHSHRHDGLCVKGSLVIGDTSLTAEQCAAIGGRKATGSAGWMSHAWVVPGCESPWGVFSAASPLLDDDLATASGKNEGGCNASGVRSRYDLTPGDQAIR